MKKLISFLSFVACVIFSANAYTTTESAALRVWAEIPEIIADGKTVNYIKVYEHDDNDLLYSAYNMEFDLPEGFSINKVKQGRDMVDDIVMSERAHTTHTISCNIVNGTNLRIIAYSSLNNDLYNDDEDGNPLDELFTIGLIADPEMKTGEYQVKFFGIKFVLNNGDACTPAAQPMYYDMKVTNTSSAKELTIEDITQEDCWDINGNLLNKSLIRPGMIIVYQGRKVLVK